MDNSNIYLFIQKMQSTGRFLSADECADFLGVSKSKLKSVIKEINLDLIPNGGTISGKTGRGNGYILQIDNQEKFDYYLNVSLKNSHRDKDYNFNSQKERVNYIVQRLLQEKEYIRSEELSQELNVSSSQLSKDLKLAKEIMNKFGINVVSKPYYGSRIVSDEKAIRQCLTAINNERIADMNFSTSYINDDDAANRFLASLKTVIVSECEKFGYHLTDFIAQNLVSHLYVAILRAKNGSAVSFNENEISDIKNTPEFELSNKIIGRISDISGIMLPEAEVYYCTMHLAGKRTMKDIQSIDEESISTVKDILKVIDCENGTFYSNDLELVYNLTLHFIPLISRIKFNIELKNPLANEIKRRYPRAVDFAALFVREVNKRYNCILSEDELTYIALHFQLEIDRRMKNNNQKVLIVCSSGLGTSSLLKARIENIYGDKFTSIKTMSALQYENDDISEYDLILSTVPVHERGKRVVLISFFMDENDIQNINRVIESNNDNSIKKFFDKKMFVSEMIVKDRDSAIRELVKIIKQYHDIPDDYFESVLTRENFASSSLYESVALPHPFEMKIDETFMAVAILKQSIKWDENNNVKIVILSNFERGFNKKNKEFYKHLDSVLSQKKIIRKIENARSFEDFLAAIEEGEKAV